MKKILFSCLFAMSLLLIDSQLHAQNDAKLYLQTSEINDVMVRYRADQNILLRIFGVGGESRQQRSLNNYQSPEGRSRLLENIEKYQKEIRSMNFDAMNINGKVDYILFNRNLENEKYNLNKQASVYNQISGLLPFSDRIYKLIKGRRRGLNVSGEEVAKELNNINKQITQSSTGFKKADSLNQDQSQLAVAAIKNLQGSLKDYVNFYNGYDPLFSWWVPKTYEETDSLLSIYGNAVRKKVRLNTTQKDDGSGIIGTPIGREELIRQLKNEFIPYTPEELVEIANKEFAWCDAELLKASREMGFGDNWKAAQEKVKNTFVPVGKQPEAMFDLYKESIDFLKKNNLVTIDPLTEEGWGMYMMSPEQQRYSPFFLGGESLLIAYPTNTMSYDEKMMSLRGNNPNYARAVVHHELIGGHHMQGYASNRYKTYRNFGTAFWHEGNALYWEMLLWDLKFPRTPEERIGMLFWRMHRCARIIFSLNYHLGKWTPQQCINFLVDRVGHERANAEGEVRRSFVGGYGPLYQIAYMIGGLQFMALKKELTDSGKMTIKEFNNAVLHENSMPVEMLRAILTNQNVKRDFTTNWRFYNSR